MRESETLARSSRRVGGRHGGRRRTAEVLVGVTALTVALVALGGALIQEKPQTQREAVRAAATERGEVAADGRVPVLTPADGETKTAKPSKHTDRRALAYFVGRKQTKRLKDIRVVGGYLRIYTDLPESADNSKRALSLCETGRDYLIGELGETNPVVFVQAKFGENGNPVLANILGHGDSDCRVTHPKPRR